MKLTCFWIVLPLFVNICFAHDGYHRSRRFRRSKKELVQLHLLFRHGDRTTVKFNYPNDPYADVDFPPGRLTPKGAEASKELGRTFRSIYNDFLGIYKPWKVEAISSSSERCIDTLKNMSSTLFPTNHHRPLEYKVFPGSTDKLLAVFNGCPNIMTPSNGKQPDAEEVAFLNKLSKVTGATLKTYADALVIHNYLMVAAETGYEIPEIIQPYWDQLNEMTKNAWTAIVSANMKDISGNLIYKIAKDMTSDLRNSPKLHLYSGHDLNIVSMLSVLGTYNKQDVNYVSYLAFEVYKKKRGYEVEIYNDNQNGKGRQKLEIPGCGYSCPVGEFTKFANKFYLGDKWCTK